MTRFILISVGMLFIGIGCSGGDNNDSQKTLTEMSMSEQPSVETPLLVDTPSIVLTFTVPATLIPTSTSTPDITREFERTLTAFKEQTPVIATLTPVQIGRIDDVVVEIPVVAADIVITEVQYQNAINTLLGGAKSVQSATVDFRNMGQMIVRLTASGGDALITGDVTLGFRVSGGLVAISVTDINIGGAQPSQQFINIIQDELQPLVIDALDLTIEQQLGEQHDLETLTLTDERMEIMLLIPAS